MSNIKILGLIDNLDKNEKSKKSKGSDDEERKVEDLSMSAGELRDALDRTNVLEVIRNARRNGWEVKLDEDKISVYKDGRLVDGTKNEMFVTYESDVQSIDPIMNECIKDQLAKAHSYKEACEICEVLKKKFGNTVKNKGKQCKKTKKARK